MIAKFIAKFVARFIGLNPALIVAIGVGIFVVGLVGGGIAVHKLYQLSQLGQLKAELSRIQEQADERVQSAQDAAQRATARANETKATIKRIKVYVPSNPACNLGPDAVRLFNDRRK